MEKNTKKRMKLVDGDNKTVMGLKCSMFFSYLLWLPIACIIIMLYLKSKGLESEGVWEYVYYLVSCLLPAFLSIAILEFGFHKYVQKESREELEQAIKSMYDEKDPMLASFSKERLKGAVRNSLSLLIGDILADKFVGSVIEELIGKKSYRTHFKYDVTFCKSVDGEQEIEQRLKYKKCFKLREETELPKTVVVIFCFGNDPFEDNILSDDMVFFCEELPHGVLTENIVKNKDDSDAILKLLKFKMWIKPKENQVPCKAEVIYSSEDKDEPVGVKISAEIYDEYWAKIDQDTASVWCKLSCRYPSEQHNFYWKFAEPTLGNVSPIEFNLYFNDKSIDGAKVKKIKYFSGANDEREDKNIEVESNRISYRSSGIYFPESGIYFHW